MIVAANAVGSIANDAIQRAVGSHETIVGLHIVDVHLSELPLLAIPHAHHLHIAEAVIDEGGLPPVLLIAATDIHILAAGRPQVFSVERAIGVESLGIAEANGVALLADADAVVQPVVCP